PLKDYLPGGKTYFGVKTGMNEAFIIDETTRALLIEEDPRSAEIIKPVVGGREIRRYSIEPKGKFLIWTYIGVRLKNYPAILLHLKVHQPNLEKRWDKVNQWWELRACD